MKKTAMQKHLALPLAVLFAAMLLVCALGFASDAHAASDGTRPLWITSSVPGAAFTVSWPGYSAEYTPGMPIPMLLPVTITCTNRTVSGWDLAGGWGGADAVLLPAGNSATLSAAAHDSGSITINVTVGADADADTNWDGSAADGSGDHGSGSEGSGSEGSGLPGSGSEGSSSNGSGTNGSGSDGSGLNGSGNNGSGNNGSGNNGSGNNGSGFDGSGNNGSGSNGSGNNGSGFDGSGNNGSGSNGSGNNGSGFDGSGNNGSGFDGSGDHGSDKKTTPTPAPQNGGNRGTTPTGSGAKTGDSRLIIGVAAMVLLSAAAFALTYHGWCRKEH